MRAAAAPAALRGYVGFVSKCGRRRTRRGAFGAQGRGARPGGDEGTAIFLGMTGGERRGARRRTSASSTFRVAATDADAFSSRGPTFTSDDDFRAGGERNLRRLTFAVCLSMVSFGCATGATGGSNRNSGSGGNAPCLFEGGGEFSGFHNGQRREVFN